MAIKFYDEALLHKFKHWTAGTHINLTGVNETKKLFEIIADSNNDKPITLPLITLNRNAGYDILNPNKKPTSYQGATRIVTPNNGAKLNIIPISIPYQIDIYARHLDEADEYARNIVFNIINYPRLRIDIPYESTHLKQDSNIRLTTGVEDNSDIPERLVSGQFVRLTIGINIDDAYLFDLRIKDNLSIVEGQLNIINNETLPNDSVDRELIFTIPKFN